MPTDEQQADTAARPSALDELTRLWGTRCVGCHHALCGHEVVFCIALGFKDAPRCLACLAIGLARAVEELRDNMWEHVRHRECFYEAWQAASRREGYPPNQLPPCLWLEPEELEEAVSDTEQAPLSGGPVAPAVVAAEWNAGETACGELVLALRMRLRGLEPGAVLKVTARDPAAPLDLPAWCRLTGHTLVAMSHPEYFIRRKEE